MTPLIRIVAALSLCAGFLPSTNAIAAIKTWQPLAGSHTWGSVFNWSPVGVPGLTDTALVDDGGFVMLFSPSETAELQIRGGSYMSSNGHDFDVTQKISVRDDNSYFGAHSDINAGQIEIGPEATFDINNGSLTTNFIELQSGATLTAGGFIDLSSGPVDVIDFAEDAVIDVQFNKTLTLTGGYGFTGDDHGTLQALVGDVVFDTWDAFEADATVLTRVGAGRSLTINAPLFWLNKKTRINLEGGTEPARLKFSDHFYSYGPIWAMSGTSEICGNDLKLFDPSPTDDSYRGTIRVFEDASLHLDLAEMLVLEDGSLTLEAGTSEVTGSPIYVKWDSHLQGSGRVATQELINLGSIHASLGGAMVIDTVEPFDMDGPSDFGTVTVGHNTEFRIAEAACPPVTTYHSHLNADGEFVMEAGNLLFASGSSVDMQTATISAPSITFAGILSTDSFMSADDILNGDVTFAAGGSTDILGNIRLIGDCTILGGHTFVDHWGDLIIDANASLTGDDGAVPQISILNEGMLAVAFGVGSFTIDNDYTQTETGTLAIDIAGNEDGEFDVLSVFGVATIDGELEVSFGGGFEPQLFDTFDVLESSTVLFGEFSSVSMPSLPAGLDWQVNYLPTRVQLEVVEGSGPSSDISGDGVVGPSDLAIILGNWGPCPAGDSCEADLSGDGVVGPSDLAIVLGNWG